MEDIQIKPFVGTQLDELVAAWNRANYADPITRERFVNLVLMDVNFDAQGLQVATYGGQVIGAAYAVRRTTAWAADDLQPQTGWIPFFFVVPEAEGQGLGRVLLTRVMDWLASRGRTEVLFSPYTPNYIVPGLDVEAYPRAAVLLRGLGFETTYQAVAMDRTLTDYRVPVEIPEQIEALRQIGYSIRSARHSDLPDVLKCSEEFNADWTRAIREAVVQGMPVANISIARDASDELVGWAMHGTYEGIADRFGPFGVLESQRGKGLGKVLLHHNLDHMRASGAHGAWFLWTGIKTAAGQLYLKAGFAVTRTFNVMRAPLGDSQIA